MSPNNDTNQDKDRRMHVEIGHVSASGHVVVAGQDANVSGNTQGDSAQGNSVTVGGVETTTDQADELKQAIKQVEKAIDEEDTIDEGTKEAARHNAQVLRTQMTSPAKPNDHLLTQAAEQLYKYGPKIAGTIVSLFMTPLAGEIVNVAGTRALEFYRKLRNPDAHTPATSTE